MNQFFQLCLENAVTASAAGKSEVLVSNASGQTLFIRGVIAPGFEANATDITAALAKADPSKPLQVQFNTPGGSVFEGKEIASAIRSYPGKTVANIVSLCASAGTSIALACDEVVMQRGAFFMIHNAQGAAFGDKTALRDTADLMEKVELTIVDDYVAKTGKSAQEIVSMMEAETWMTSEEALSRGFVDRIASDGGVSNTWNLSAYAKPPQALAPKVDNGVPAPEESDGPASLNAAEITFLRAVVAQHEATITSAKAVLPLAQSDDIEDLAEQLIQDHAGQVALMQTWISLNAVPEPDEDPTPDQVDATVNNMTQANRNRLTLLQL